MGVLFGALLRNGRRNLGDLDLFGLPLKGSGNQPMEQRVRPRRTGAEFRVSLGRNVVGMDVSAQLDVLDEPAIRGSAAEVHARLLEPGTVVVVDLKAVPVSLFYVWLAVDLTNDRSISQLGGVQAEPHGAAHVTLTGDNVTLVRHRGDDWVRR